MKKRCLLGLSVCILMGAGTTGCVSYSTLHTAKPLEEGRVQITLSPNAYGIVLRDDQDATSRVLPTAEIAVRVGIAENMDVGTGVFPMGGAVDLNYAIINEPGLVLSLNPYISITHLNDDFGATSTNSAITYGVALFNILADLVTSDIFTLTVGVKPGILYGVGYAEDFKMATGAVAGALAGLTIRLGDDISLMPAVDLLMPVQDFGEVLLYTGSVALNFGL